MVHKRQLPVGGSGRCTKADMAQFMCNSFPETPIFLHRESMSGRQGQHKVIAVKGHHHLSLPKCARLHHQLTQRNIDSEMLRRNKTLDLLEKSA